MSTINGFHPPPSSTTYNGQSETSKRLPSTSSTSSTSSNSTTATNKRLKTKVVVSTTIHERRPTKGFSGTKSKGFDSNKKRSVTSDSNNNSTKKVKISSLPSSPPPPRSRHLIQHPILHQHKKSSSSSPSSRSSQLQHIPSSSSESTHHNLHNHHHHHHHHHHHPQINNDFCDSCGECYGELISCDTCPATFHLLCANPPLSREDVPTGSYFCENCRAKTVEEDLKKTTITSTPLPPPPKPKPFSFDPKKKLTINGFKQSHQQRADSTLGQIKLPTASNGRSLIQASGEIKFRATSNKNRPATSSSSSSSNLKRKRVDSSPPTSTSASIVSPMKLTSLTPQIDALRRLLISCRPEEFRGPSLPFDNSTYTRDLQQSDSKNAFIWQKYCFICRKSSTIHGPSIHCDYCPLTYHLDCLTPPMTGMPSSTDKWMCPNHIEPILDRFLLKKKMNLSERVKLYQKYAQIESNTIIQEFTRMRQTRKYLLSTTINNDRLQRIDISQIPQVIEEFYFKANLQRKNIEHKNHQEECVQTSITATTAIEPSTSYDPCVWDTLQAILDHIVEGRIYEPLSLPIENDIQVTSSSVEKEPNVLDTIDILLDALNEPNYSIPHRPTPAGDGLAALVAAASSLDKEQTPSSSSTSISSQLQILSSLSLLIDLTQFRSSHAALIHTRSRHVLYIQKRVIWFGSSASNDVCLTNFNDSQTCRHVSERHACLYYDTKRNLFELLNYSEYGTIINGLRYGLGNISDDDEDGSDDEHRRKMENEYLQRCFCLTAPSYHSAWDGPAGIEQGTVVKIGCHEFIFYRHVVR